MINATGNPQSILLLGGSSEIGLAIVREYLAGAPARVVLAARPGNPALAKSKADLLSSGATAVDIVDFDATDFGSHPGVLDECWAAGDIDVAIVAWGVLGDAEQLWQDQRKAIDAVQVNYTGAVSIGVLLGQRMSEQGHGQIIVMSSVAGERVRRSNFVYGSTKAALDSFFLNLGEALQPAGVKVLVVRPGMVRTQMSAGLKEAPLTVDPDVVAEQVVKAAGQGKDLIWTPSTWRFVMLVLKHIPRPIFRRLPI